MVDPGAPDRPQQDLHFQALSALAAVLGEHSIRFTSCGGCGGIGVEIGGDPVELQGVDDVRTENQIDVRSVEALL